MINNQEDLAAWLQKQPAGVSVAFAARAVLRILPIVKGETSAVSSLIPGAILVPVFRATAVSWAAARYPTHAIEFSTAALTAQSFSTARHANTASLAAATAALAGDAAQAAIIAAAATAIAALKLADDALNRTFWTAVSTDAMHVEENETASILAGSPLWRYGQPVQLRSLWQEMKAALLAAGQDWQVWTNWYDDRLAGRVKDEALELVYVRIDESLWDQGPEEVNAEINRRIEEHETPQNGVVQVPLHGLSAASVSARASMSVAEQAISAVPGVKATAIAQPLSEVLAAWQSADAALQTPRYAPQPFSPPSIDTPHPGRQYVPDVLSNPVVPGAGGTPPAPIEAIPEQEPIATRFGVSPQGLIDVVPDPPAHGTASDPLQREFYGETRVKAQSLVDLGPNQLGELNDPANRFCDGLKDRIEDISITSLWSRGNTLRIRLNAHDLSTGNEETDPGR